jgi:hypothetical protein
MIFYEKNMFKHFFLMEIFAVSSIVYSSDHPNSQKRYRFSQQYVVYPNGSDEPAKLKNMRTDQQIAEMTIELSQCKKRLENLEQRITRIEKNNTIAWNIFYLSTISIALYLLLNKQLIGVA